jgi:hypothetical protein
MNGALLPIAVLGSLAVAAETRSPAPEGVEGSASYARRIGGVLLITAGATLAVLWPKRASAAVQMPASLPWNSRTPEPPEPPELDTTLEVRAPAASPAPPATPTGPTADDPFYTAILRGIGASSSSEALTFFRAWRQAEGGTARYNPFNTTQRMPGSEAYNRVGVQHYPSARVGVDATVKTLLNDRYTALVQAIREGRSARAMADALAASPWGTGTLAQKILDGYAAGRSVKAPPIASLPGSPATVVGGTRRRRA